MEHPLIRQDAIDAIEKLSDFSDKLLPSLMSFLNAYDLADAVKANGIDEIVLLGMAASFQIREWERMGILEHMPFHPSFYREVCENAPEFSRKYNIEHLKSFALLIDVNIYYLVNFTRISKRPRVDPSPEAIGMMSAAQSSLWKSGVLAELNPNRFTLSASASLVEISTVHEMDATPAIKRSRARDSMEGTWSEKEAAKYSGYSVSTMKRMRSSGEIPPALYRQRTKGGKIRYFQKSYKEWFEQRPKK